MKDFDELRSVLELERIEDNLYRGLSYRTPWGRVFGGQVLAQSIHAAQLTTPDDRNLHSMHAYFLLAGDIDLPIVYLSLIHISEPTRQEASRMPSSA